MNTLFHSFLFRRLFDTNDPEYINLIVKPCEHFCWNIRSFRFSHEQRTRTDKWIEIEFTFSIEITERNANSKIASLFAFAESMDLMFLGHHAVTFEEL